ncbi:FAD/NAD(P)-binding domain-containing protein [Phanerochaete sordida]|uniref:FAD/NAD(P)-binding domain-containing protein n=1 Tax=Phanerochaete sordida TaxID=48140 RepID=A0A9P3GKW1_9APHY|nr:FAD/NAD(P)-binding domain-containing protein [Phanerochaete sordida]
MQSTKRTVKVAVVGSGLAGLTAAYRLAQGSDHGDVHVEVHLFEKAATIGMDSQSISVAVPGSGKQRVDVPMRSFQGGYYKQMIELYRELGVTFSIADFSYSFSTLKHFAESAASEINATMIYNGSSGTKGVSMPASARPSRRMPISPLFAFVSQAQAYLAFAFGALLMGIFYLRLLAFCLPLHVPERIHIPETTWSIPLWLPIPHRMRSDMTLLEWREATAPRSPFSKLCGLDRKWRDFVTNVVMPLFSAVCTASAEDIWNHPVEEFLDYIYITLGAHHYVVMNGVRDVVQKITVLISPGNIHTSCSILGLQYNPDTSLGPTVDIHCVGDRTFHGFSHIVCATQANHAIPLLTSYLRSLPETTNPKNPANMEEHRSLVQAQIDSLTKFKYIRTVVINHTDPSLLPASQRDRRDLNLVMASPEASKTLPRPAPNDWKALTVAPDCAMATHVLPRVNGVYQTTNPIVPPRADSILSVARLERALVTRESKRALQALWTDGERRGWRWGCEAQNAGRLGPVQGAGALDADKADRTPGLWLCGSYASCGIPLLEGCVASATNVVEQGIWECEGL